MALFARVHLDKLLRNSKIALYTRSCCSKTEKKGLVLGVYSKKDQDGVCLTNGSKIYNENTNGKLLEAIQLAGNQVKQGKKYQFWALDKAYKSVTVVGLGDEAQGYNEHEELDERKEAIRNAANIGFKTLKEAGMTHIDVDDMGDGECAAEGAILSSWQFNEYKTKKKDTPSPPTIGLYNKSTAKQEWERGSVKAQSQNIARKLMDTPANLMTPIIFACTAKELLEPLCVKVEIRDVSWATDKKMGGFLSVTRGSVEPPVFLEISYKKGKASDGNIVFVGKGVTFDSGGISLKPSLNMDQMRADMGGAACVVGAIHAISKLRLPVNVVGLIPLCENMPSGSATKPGDVITCMNGKTVCVDNTDAEGRLILADALCYSREFKPKYLVDLATLTGAMVVALGDAASGVFTNSSELWREFQRAGAYTGDRVWRMPLWKHYTKLVTDYPAFDVNNVGKGKGGGSCTAAAFLREFVPEGVQWMHMDIASVMGPADQTPYLGAGMKGRPTRTLIQFIEQLKDKKVKK